MFFRLNKFEAEEYPFFDLKEEIKTMLETKGNMITEIVSSDDKKHTYSIKKTIEGAEGKDGIILQINPTINADELNHTDSTTLHIMNHLSEMGLRSIQMINLFSKVCRGKMSAKNLEIDIDNIKYIEAVMKDKTFKDKLFIVAWGSSMEHSKACNQSKQEIVRMFRKHCRNGTIWQINTTRLDTSKYSAVHALFLGIRHKNEKWSLMPFDDTEILKQIKESKPKLVENKEQTNVS